MPVIVVGADTPGGRLITEALAEPGREVRAFVTDADAAMELKELGVKVALGDVSDDTHVEGAATNSFSAVLITEAASDDRERAFAAESSATLRGWARAVTASRVKRVIWVGDQEPPETPGAETAVVSPTDPGVVAKVVALDEAQTISNALDTDR